MIKIATPISHMFNDALLAKQIIDISDCLECRDKTIDNQSPNQELFHCELEPIHKLTEEDFVYLANLKDKKKDLKLITFHMATSCSKPILEYSKVKSGMFEVGGYSYTRNEMLDNAKNNFMKIKDIFKNDVKIAVENNNFYPSEAYKYITDAEFISEVVEQNDIYFLFDIAHAQVTAHNKGIDFEEYKNKLPLNRIIQLHICSPDIDSETNIAYDAHNYPDNFKLEEVDRLIKKYPNIKYLTVEYYRDIENLIKSINKIKGIINVCNI